MVAAVVIRRTTRRTARTFSEASFASAAASPPPWKVLHIMNQGQWKSEAVRLFPVTTAIVQSLPSLLNKCIFGNVFFSHVQQGSGIPPHCGPTNIRHRLHLALKVVAGSSSATTTATTTFDSRPRLLVRETVHYWTESRAFCFDDSLRHAVEYPMNNNKSSSLHSSSSSSSTTLEKERIVLIVDLWHPDLSEAERSAVQDLYPAI